MSSGTVDVHTISRLCRLGSEIGRPRLTEGFSDCKRGKTADAAAAPLAIIQLLGKHATLSGKSVQRGHLWWYVAIEVSDARGG